MNTKMYLHPTTQHSIEKLKSMKIEILETASGVLACGEVGSGKLLEPALILQEIENRLTPNLGMTSNNITTSMRVLITAGGTSEPIDDVRVITNKSTGKTAAEIADALIRSGIQVTYLHSTRAILPEGPCEKLQYETFQDLKTIMLQTLQQTNYHAVIHVAAISDYSVVPFVGKINSDRDEVLLTLKKNPKLINEIKKISPDTQLFGFKLTSTQDQSEVLKKVTSLFELAQCDFVIQNDWSDIQKQKYHYHVFDKSMASENIEGLGSLSSIIFQKLVNNSLKETL